MQPTKMNREQAAQIVDEQVLMLRKMNKKYGAKYDQLARECAELPSYKAYDKYMQEKPKGANPHQWGCWMMHRMDIVIGRMKAW